MRVEVNYCSRPTVTWSPRNLVLFLALISVTQARKHHLVISNDARRFFPISTFGFYQGGYLSVNVTHLQAMMPRENESDLVLGEIEIPPNKKFPFFSI